MLHSQGCSKSTHFLVKPLTLTNFLSLKKTASVFCSTWAFPTYIDLLFALCLSKVSDQHLRNKNKIKKLGWWSALNTLHASYCYVMKEPTAKLLYTWLYKNLQLHHQQRASWIKDQQKLFPTKRRNLSKMRPSTYTPLSCSYSHFRSTEEHPWHMGRIPYKNQQSCKSAFHWNTFLGHWLFNVWECISCEWLILQVIITLLPPYFAISLSGEFKEFVGTGHAFSDTLHMMTIRRDP